MKYYAVKKGVKTGIFESWDICKELVVGYKGAEYKSFSNLEDAKNYINDVETVTNFTLPTAYVDGSFDKNTNRYSFGAVLFYNEKLYTFKKAFEPDMYSGSRNVAGEIRGAAFIINYAIKNGIKELNLIYDYKGIEEFYKGTWHANKELSGLYQEFANIAKDKIKVNFIKVKSHSNDKYNDMVDSLAKEALGL